MKLKVQNLSYSINSKQILNQVEIAVHKGEVVGLVGPNGSGKSTLLRNIYRAINPDQGDIIIDEKDIKKLSYKKTAKMMSVLRQESSTDFDYRVDEVVIMGRAPHHKIFEPDTIKDHEIVEASLRRVGMLDYSDRFFSTLSGGEKQRVLIARALAQQTDLLILDEPTNHLDIHYKLQVMELVKSLNKTVLAAIHDLEIASMYCHKIVVIKEGGVVAFGTPSEVLTSDLLREVFRVKTRLSFNNHTRHIQIAYTGIV